MSDRLPIIREFISNHVNGLSLDDDVDIFATGYVTSLFAVQLVMFVESRFGIPVNGDDLDIRNFKTISQIDSFIYERMATVAA